MMIDLLCALILWLRFSLSSLPFSKIHICMACVTVARGFGPAIGRWAELMIDTFTFLPCCPRVAWLNILNQLSPNTKKR